ncbi:alpha/beta fold hydrolase [Paracoccus sp. MBLB3053]|uniref:Alpha/beta fold hydrolase n=1 Tax=Paracoccus aurantius TaxID=3073814 RepID=A0ABU2HZL0_9RHOB|nr:alpha/beta fold hydrolase [Paracoccus sp. MBLB3053]MDS9469965.1 alpha/beta fold hydrolase [Paracoccus sp. MBLB3053]
MARPRGLLPDGFRLLRVILDPMRPGETAELGGYFHSDGEGEDGWPVFWPWPWPVTQAWPVLCFTGKRAEDYPWFTPNRVLLDQEGMRLRVFGQPARGVLPVLIVAPHAGHSATIADFAQGQSIVAALLSAGIPAIMVTDWKPARREMRDFTIESYLLEIDAAIDELGGKVHLVGLCQGGWMSAMIAARNPGKVVSMVLAGSPVDAGAGNGAISRLANSIPFATYEQMVMLGGGLMPGPFMLAGWESLRIAGWARASVPQGAEDEEPMEYSPAFAHWYQHTLDLPGRYYLEVVWRIFKRNELAKGRFEALGQVLSLADVTCPTWLLAGQYDRIVPPEQAFATAGLLGSREDDVVRRLVPDQHIGLFMGKRTIATTWPEIGRWILSRDQAG